MAVKISVIMPVYNAAEFLEEALDSIINQTFKDYELIAVDDGSKDQSLNILKKYQKKYSFIQVIAQKNAGPSAARNAGLNVASGEYIYFPDADDLLEKKCLEWLYQRAQEKQADLVIARYDTFNRISRTKVNNIDRITEEDRIDPFDQDILLTFSLCNKLFRRDVIEQNKMMFPPVSYSEDGVFVMQYVYIAKNITGLPKVIYHYRKITDGIHASITSAVSKEKTMDYLQAHKMIYDSMVYSFQTKYEGESENIQFLMKQFVEVSDYVNAFIKKEITVLLNQFYKKFWSFEDVDVIDFIANEIDNLLKRLDLKNYNQLCETHYELNMTQLFRDYESAVRDARVSVLLYADENQRDNFVNTMINLRGQNMIPFLIVVPEAMKSCIEEENIQNDNIAYISCDNRNDFWYKGYQNCRTDYIMFEDAFFNIAPMAVKEMYIVCDKNQYDFMTFGVYYADSLKQYPIKMHSQVLRALQDFRQLPDQGDYELFLQNKIFATKFLKDIDFKLNKPVAEVCKDLYDVGFYFSSLKRFFAFQGDASQFVYDVIENECTYAQAFETASLKDASLNTDRKKINKIIPIDWEHNKKDDSKKKFLDVINRLPVQSRVLFMAEKNGMDHENLFALKEAIGKKNKCMVWNKEKPYNKANKLLLYYYIATSKVIVVDAPTSELCVIPLKKEQKVIQLWNYPGSVMKMGIHDSVLPYDTECAMHLQYNLVCTSSDYGKPIFSDAFQIPMKHVKAVGSPRTDLYFDSEKRNARIANVYRKNPEWKEKDIILYVACVDNNKTYKHSIQTQLKKVASKLKDSQLLVVAKTKDTDDYENQKICYESSIALQDLMLVSNAMISERIEIAPEYALLEKPMLIYECCEMEEQHPYFINSMREIPAYKTKDIEEVLRFVCDSKKYELKEQASYYRKKYLSGCDGASAKRIAKIINQYIKGE